MKKRLFIGSVLSLLGVGILIQLTLSADVPRMTIDELKASIGNPDLVILDVRSGRDWTRGEAKIKGAIRVEPDEIESWAHKYTRDKILVLYCA